MGKMLISNNKSKYEQLDEIFERSKFEPAWKGDIICVYKKLNTKSYNYFKGPLNDYICCTGTLFYKGLFGIECLAELYKDFDINKIAEILSRTIGSFALAIRKNDCLYVFTDPLATYFLYYYDDGEEFTITNTYYHINLAYKFKLDIQYFFAIAVRGGTNIGKLTPYKEIKRLLGNEYIEIDQKNNKFKLKNYSCSEKNDVYETKTQFINFLYKKIKKDTEIYNRYLPNQLFFLTGGVDSRLEIAVRSKLKNCKCKTAYWIGNDVITNGTQNDWECCKEVSKLIGAESRLFDVSMGFKACLDSLAPEMSYKYGEYASIYAGNRKWFSIFEDLTCIDAVNFGYTGEVIRGLSQADSISEYPINIEKFIRTLYLRTGIVPKLIQTNNLIKIVSKELVDSFGGNNIMSKEEAVYLFDMTRLSADCRLNNFVNMFSYSYPLLMQKDIYKALRVVPYKWRTNDNITISLMNLFDPRMLNIKFFSHHNYMVLDKDKNMLVYSKASIYKAKIKKIGQKLGLQDVYVKYLKKYFNKRNKFDNDIYDICLEYLESCPLCSSNNIKIITGKSAKNIDVDQLATIVALLKVNGL